MAPDVVCTGRSFDVGGSIFGKQSLTLTGNNNNKASQPLRLHLVDVLADRWVSLTYHSADGHLQQRNKTSPHYCADGKAQAGWPVHRHKGRFLSFLFLISWLHLIFIRFSNSLRGLYFLFPWQGARGCVIPCDRYTLTQAGRGLFSPFCCHPSLLPGGRKIHGDVRNVGQSWWLHLYWRSFQWGGEGHWLQGWQHSFISVQSALLWVWLVQNVIE